MQVWNVLDGARWKYRTQKWRKKSSSGPLGTIAQLCRAVSSQLGHISIIRKKNNQQFLLHMSSQYGELRPTNCWYPFTSLGHPCKFQRVLRLGSVTARHSSSGRRPNCAALNRGCHLYSAGRPSRWALAHILASFFLLLRKQVWCSLTITGLRHRNRFYNKYHRMKYFQRNLRIH